MGFLKEFVQFVKKRKLWWLTPVFIALLVLGIVFVLAQSSAVAPFIYTLF